MSTWRRLFGNWQLRVPIILAVSCLICFAYASLDAISFADVIRQEALQRLEMDGERGAPGISRVVVGSMIKLFVMMVVPAMLVVFVPKVLGAVSNR